MTTITPRRFFSIALSLAVLATATAAGLPMSASAKAPATRAVKPLENTASYVDTVFDKLQGQWVMQAVNNQVTGNHILTFTLDENGLVSNSQLDGTPTTLTENETIQQFLKENAPFAPFPAGLKGSQLSFKLKITPESLQMLSYQVLDRSKDEPTIAFAAASVAQPASMYYTRVLPVTPGKVWDKPDSKTTSAAEQTMTDYVAQVQQQVRQHWQLPQDYNFQRTVARLLIDRDGSLLGVQLTQSSGDKTVDQAALKAITDAGVFPRVPANAPSLPVTIEYVFEPVHQTE